VAAGLVAIATGGCGVNPVTGGSEVSFVSEAEEIRIGQAQYGPGQQTEGGVYTLDPQLSAYVQRVGESLARVSDRPQLPYEFVVLNNSVPNAWALPGGKLAINRGLLYQLQSESELAAVLGHEIVHAAARHGAKQQEKGTLLNLGLAVLGVATAGSGYGDLAMQGAQIGGALIQTRYGREAELEADRYGMEYMARAGYDPRGAVTLQESFVRLAAGKEQGGLAALFASHPPSQERVDANRRTAARLNVAGREGRAEYAQATARLRRDKPAYDAYDKATQAYQAKRYEQALKLAGQAIRLQPKEGQFHELAGMANARLDRPAEAVRSLNSAVALNQGHYRPHLLRGMLHLERNNLDVAREDFTVANRRLPTAEATFGLGEIAQRQGDAQTAIRHYQQVARSQSALAATARDRIARLGGGNYR
jgi:predicted Zn-dependent protease